MRSAGCKGGRSPPAGRSAGASFLDVGATYHGPIVTEVVKHIIGGNAVRQSLQNSDAAIRGDKLREMPEGKWANGGKRQLPRS